MFGQRKRLRRIAASVLLGWFFALGAGVVNACIVAAATPPAEPAAASGANAEPTAGPVHRHDEGAAGAPASEHRWDTVSATCARFCDDSSASVAVLLPKADSRSSVAAAPSPRPALHVTAPGHHTAGVRTAAPTPPRVPIPIAFLRLTR